MKEKEVIIAPVDKESVIPRRPLSGARYVQNDNVRFVTLREVAGSMGYLYGFCILQLRAG